MIASHHPKLFNTLARDYGIRLSRTASGEVEASRFVAPDDSPLTASELIEQGELS
jgi:hypothetical protein